MRLLLSLSTILAAATSVTASCNNDNCLNQANKYAASASGFCMTYTTTVNTNPAAIPTYLSNCKASPSRVSSACSCLVTGAVTTSSSTSTSKPVTSTTSTSSTTPTTSKSSTSTTSSKSSTSTTSTSSTLTTLTTSTRTSSSSSTSSASTTATAAAYWLEQIKHQGISAFNAKPATYQVFRNVKDFGAKGDGVTDDTVAINNAMTAGGRSLTSSTTTPAVVYFPCGTYLLSASIIDYYYTQIIGNPNCMPTLKATSNFNGFGLIDGDVYGAGGLANGATNVFYKQIRNLVFDITAIPAGTNAKGVHWPTAQATSLQNCVFRVSDAPGTQHVGLFVEDGSGGFMSDLIFYGGLQGVWFGNQQFTVRNLTFNNAVTAVYQNYDWGWTYQAITINNCSVGIDMSNGGPTGQAVGSIIVTDSTFKNTGIAILSAHNTTSLPPTAGSLVLDNVSLLNTPVAVQGPSGVELVGGTTVVTGWGQGHSYTPTGPTNFQSALTLPRPAVLTPGGIWYARSKPQYESSPLSQFVSARSAGAAGDGVTDDTAALQALFTNAKAADKIVFIDAGTYKVTSTLTIPPNSRVVGESYSVIMGSGSFFSQISSPQPVVQIGLPGQTGQVEWSDMIVSTQGGTAGAILIQWNLAAGPALYNSAALTSGGMWDVHTRIGGFAGSQLQVAQCPTTATPSAQCYAAFMSMYIAPSASGVYLENTWFWTADHDIEDAAGTRVSVFTGRGLLCASTAGTIWMWGTAVEHHDLYQYQFLNTQNVYAGQLQTETPYWQPAPAAGVLTPIVPGFSDPNFATSCTGVAGNCAMSWGLRVVNSANLYFYGAGLYSFFNNYSVVCSNAPAGSTGNGAGCQARIFSIEGSASKGVYTYNLNTVGAAQMVTRDGVGLAAAEDNVNVYPDTVAVFRTG